MMTDDGKRKLIGLDLFSGIGGLSLSLEPWVRTIAYCESDRYAQGVLLSRMLSGDLDQAPIFSDVRGLSVQQFVSGVDIIFGGFPCQDISVAGLGKGLDGERSGLFKEIIRLTIELEPLFIFLENVPAIRTRGLGVVVKELAKRGYDCRWTMLSAQDVGAPHKRNRWFLLATNTNGVKLRDWSERCSEGQAETDHQSRDDGAKESLADTNSGRCKVVGLKESGRLKGSQWSESNGCGSVRKLEHTEDIANSWAIEPDVGRVAHGIPDRVDRLRTLGNSVVPLQARTAFKELIGME